MSVGENLMALFVYDLVLVQSLFKSLPSLFEVKELRAFLHLCPVRGHWLLQFSLRGLLWCLPLCNFLWTLNVNLNPRALVRLSRHPHKPFETLMFVNSLKADLKQRLSVFLILEVDDLDLSCQNKSFFSHKFFVELLNHHQRIFESNFFINNLRVFYVLYLVETVQWRLNLQLVEPLQKLQRTQRTIWNYYQGHVPAPSPLLDVIWDTSQRNGTQHLLVLLLVGEWC